MTSSDKTQEASKDMKGTSGPGCCAISKAGMVSVVCYGRVLTAHRNDHLHMRASPHRHARDDELLVKSPQTRSSSASVGTTHLSSVCSVHHNFHASKRDSLSRLITVIERNGKRLNRTESTGVSIMPLVLHSSPVARLYRLYLRASHLCREIARKRSNRKNSTGKTTCYTW